MAVSRVANSDTFKVTTPSDREITLTRLFDAPRRLVFDAMTKPEHVRRWWGILDERYSLVQCDIDLASRRRVALDRPRPPGRVRLPRGVSRDRSARTPRVHGDLRSVSRRRIGRDDDLHRGERQDPAHRHVQVPSRSRSVTWSSRPAWNAAPPSATTVSKRWRRSSIASDGSRVPPRLPLAIGHRAMASAHPAEKGRCPSPDATFPW